MLCNSEVDNFYLTDEELRDSPSSKDGIPADMEAALRFFGAQLIQEATILLELPQAVAATGQVLLQRFYCKRSFKQYNVKKLAAAATYLAVKLEECTTTRVRDVIMVFDRLYKRKEGAARLDIMEPGSNNYHAAKDAIIKYERDMLRAFGFIVHADHPHKLLINIAKLLETGEADADKQLLQMAWNMANDSLRTTLCVRFKSEVVVCGALFYAARKLQVPLPETDGQCWWQALGVTDHQLAQAVLALHWLYQQPRAEYINVLQVLQTGGGAGGGGPGGARGFGAGPRAGRAGAVGTPEVTTVMTGTTGAVVGGDDGRAISLSPLQGGAGSGGGGAAGAGATRSQQAGGSRANQQVTGPKGSELAALGGRGAGAGGGPALPGVAEGNEVMSTAHQEGGGADAARDSEAMSRPHSNPQPDPDAAGKAGSHHRRGSRTPPRPAGAEGSSRGAREEGAVPFPRAPEERSHRGTQGPPRASRSRSPRSRSRSRSRTRSRSRDRRGAGGEAYRSRRDGNGGGGGGHYARDRRDEPRDRRAERGGRDDRGGHYDRDRDRRDGGGRPGDRHPRGPGGGGAGTGYGRDRDRDLRDRERGREKERERERERERQRERERERERVEGGGRGSAPPARRGSSAMVEEGADGRGGKKAAAGNGVHSIQSPPSTTDNSNNPVAGGSGKPHHRQPKGSRPLGNDEEGDVPEADHVEMRPKPARGAAARMGGGSALEHGGAAAEEEREEDKEEEPMPMDEDRFPQYSEEPVEEEEAH